MPGGNWIALKGLISGKPPPAHHNQSPPAMPIYIPQNTLATGFLYSCCSTFLGFMPMTSRFVRRRTGVIDCSVKRTAGRCRPLSRCMRIKGERGATGGRFFFLEINAASHSYSYKHSVPREPPSTPTNKRIFQGCVVPCFTLKEHVRRSAAHAESWIYSSAGCVVVVVVNFKWAAAEHEVDLWETWRNYFAKSLVFRMIRQFARRKMCN